jgi:MATE family multidrug resistance protein
MLVQVFCFWGIGLAGGAWLCYRAPQPLGVAGFWLAAVARLVLAACLLGPLLRWTARANDGGL